jgi:hypothetical protein
VLEVREIKMRSCRKIFVLASKKTRSVKAVKYSYKIYIFSGDLRIWRNCIYLYLDSLTLLQNGKENELPVQQSAK